MAPRINLTPEQKAELLRLRASGHTDRQLAQQFGLSDRKQVAGIARGAGAEKKQKSVQWTQEMVDLLVRERAKSTQLPKISKMLGIGYATTRKKAIALGLSLDWKTAVIKANRQRNWVKTTVRKRPEQTRQQKMEERQEVAGIADGPPSAPRLDLFELPEGTAADGYFYPPRAGLCQWPFGDKPIKFCCNSVSVSGLPYCHHHCQFAYKTGRFRPAAE